ncbi:hypothetical protein [Micromonospora taraxaci]|uniref:hypothetical protein n=1 Tax=Micromonospora taraxaci TaxID=1316803 RepID=UPI0033A48F43
MRHAGFLTLDALTDALTWCTNTSQCRAASKMPELAVTLFQDAAHLGVARVAVFRESPDLVLTYEQTSSSYTYLEGW